jgi:hypothetical protein
VSAKKKFDLNFVGFSGMGSLDQYEATIVVPPEYDLVGIISSLFFADGSRGITLHFKREDVKLGRRGYSLKQEWEQLPQGQTQLNNSISSRMEDKK